MEKDLTKERLEKLIEFYRKNQRAPEVSEDRELASLACHVRHCHDGGNYDYPSLYKRYPEECKTIHEIEKKVIIKSYFERLKLFKDNEQSIKKNKDDIRILAFLYWCKEQGSEYIQQNFKNKIDLISLIKEDDMEVDVQIENFPKRKEIDKKKDQVDLDIKNRGISKEDAKSLRKFYSDYNKVEELISKVESFKKDKKSFKKYLFRFFDSPSEFNLTIEKDLNLLTSINEFIDSYQTMINFLYKDNEKDEGPSRHKVTTYYKNIDLLTTDNIYIKEVVEDERNNIIIFKG